ncbi:hypothetical protein ACFZB9_04485 [Kitasatospora sp. NPDC008050]|uniref:hypothetical protein n=1 Tax=Kitasatospora sp. NPDC008050 TaxID=3364021 RepID=UPI0036E35A71
MYVRTGFTKDELAFLVAMALGGTVQRAAWGVIGVSGESWEVTLSANPVTGEPDDDFVNWPWQIEYEPESVPTAAGAAVRDMGALLEALWAAGHWAVAACDYEHLLPNSGGWHAGRYLGQPGAV